MGKTPETLQLEDQIFKATSKQGVFGCFEVTIGWWGDQRVDYMTYNTKGEFRCYELKVSVSDFHSKAKISFVGDFNYYVLTRELYENVKGKIPKGVGVYVGGICERRATKQTPKVDKKVLYESMIRSLSREYQNTRKSEDRNRMAYLERRIREEERKRDTEERRFSELYSAVFEVFGQNGINKCREYTHRNDNKKAGDTP